MTLADAGLVRSIANALHTHKSDAKFASVACEALHVLSYVQSQNCKDLFLREGACDALLSAIETHKHCVQTVTSGCEALSVSMAFCLDTSIKTQAHAHAHAHASFISTTTKPLALGGWSNFADRSSSEGSQS